MANILGLNAYHGDASAALVKDGILVAAIEDERLNRLKHCAGFPTMAARAVLGQAGIGPEDIDHVGFSRDPRANLHKKILFAVRQPGFVGQVRDSSTARNGS
jgi:carbamoyltransferase